MEAAVKASPFFTPKPRSLHGYFSIFPSKKHRARRKKRVAPNSAESHRSLANQRPRHANYKKETEKNLSNSPCKPNKERKRLQLFSDERRNRTGPKSLFEATFLGASASSEAFGENSCQSSTESANYKYKRRNLETPRRGEPPMLLLN